MYNNQYGGYNNPYARYNSPNLNQMMSNLNQNMQNLNYLEQNRQAVPQQNNLQSGSWYEVSDFSQVQNTPARADGLPTLFYNFNTMEMWSKKLLDGKECISPFFFSPAMAQETKNDLKSVSNDSEEEKEKIEVEKGVLDTLVKEIEKLKTNQKKINEKYNKISKNNKKEEVVKNEI